MDGLFSILVFRWQSKETFARQNTEGEEEDPRGTQVEIVKVCMQVAKIAVTDIRSDLV